MVLPPNRFFARRSRSLTPAANINRSLAHSAHHHAAPFLSLAPCLSTAVLVSFTSEGLFTITISSSGSSIIHHKAVSFVAITAVGANAIISHHTYLSSSAQQLNTLTAYSIRVTLMVVHVFAGTPVWMSTDSHQEIYTKNHHTQHCRALSRRCQVYSRRHFSMGEWWLVCILNRYEHLSLVLVLGGVIFIGTLTLCSLASIQTGPSRAGGLWQGYQH